MEYAKISFLQAETMLNSEQKIITTSKLLYWFSGDFMGKKGIKKIISSVLDKDVTAYSLQFRNYDGTPELKNFI